MSRIALSSVERAQREILPLDLALYHAARDYPGGAAAIAATTGRNATTLQHKLSPTHPSHTVNIQEFGEILELTKDRRILDAVHALVGDTTWQELAEALDFPVGHGDGYLHIYSDDPNAYGLRVIGDSMHPRIKSGEYVLIEPNKMYITGDEVMVQTQDGRSMIKEFIYLRDGVYRFDSVNQDHSPLHLDQQNVSKVHLVGGILKSSRFAHDKHE